MSISRFIKRLVGERKPVGGRTAFVRNAIAWIFIALVALFLTHPAGGPFSVPGMQVPWPAELGLDGSLPGLFGG